MRECVWIGMLIAALHGTTVPGRAAPLQEPDGARYAVIISGIGGEPQYVEQHWQWASGLYRVLRDEHGFAKERLFLLAENPSADPATPARKSALEDIKQVFGALAGQLTPRDLLFVLLIGHGSTTETDPKLSIPGPDLTAAALAGLLAPVKAGRIVVVNGASASAPFIDALSGPGRVIITATKSGRERLATVFPEHFLAALSIASSDLDKDGRVSLLEAFTYACLKTEAWYEEQGRLATEHPLLDDNGDGVGSRDPGGADPDGALARAITFGGRPTLARPPDMSPESRNRVSALERQAADLQEQIETLKRDKANMSAEAYASRLEALLVRLARVNKEIKAAQAEK